MTNTTVALKWTKTPGGVASATASVGGGRYARAEVGDRAYEVWAHRSRRGEKGERSYVTRFSAGYREAGKWTELALEGPAEKSNPAKALAAVARFAASVQS